MMLEHNKQAKNIEVSIERTIENGEDLTNVVITGKGDITREELEEELDRMLEKQGINKEKTKLNIEMEIQINLKIFDILVALLDFS